MQFKSNECENKGNEKIIWLKWTRKQITYKFETKAAEVCSTEENLKGTLEQMGNQMKNVSEKFDSLRESISDEDQ